MSSIHSLSTSERTPIGEPPMVSAFLSATIERSVEREEKKIVEKVYQKFRET